MGSDNQDYFKRAGRSGGPPGPLSQFKARLSQERAALHRGQERRIPGEIPPAARGPGAPPRPGQPIGRGHHETSGPQPGAPTKAPHEAAASPGASEPPHEAGAPPGASEAPSEATAPSGTSEPPREATPPSGATQASPPQQAGAPWTATLDRTAAPPRADPRDAGDERAGESFGIPASEEAATGSDTPYAREAEARWHDERHAHRVGERMARAFPPPFRLLGGAARVVDRPIRRTLDRLRALGDVARRS